MPEETLNLYTAITACAAAILSLCTFIHQCTSSRRTIITQTITKERVDWIKQARETLLSFEKAYRLGDYRSMFDAKARLESLMRRDTPQYCMILKHIDECMREGFTEVGYSKLLGLSAYILARAWQRVKIDGESLLSPFSACKNSIVSRRTSTLLSMVASDYLQGCPTQAMTLFRKIIHKMSLCIFNGLVVIDPYLLDTLHLK